MSPFVPEELPLENLDFGRLLPFVGKANASLARYDGLLQGIPNPAVMLSPLTTQEAVLSSRIEGTQATVDEVLEHEAGMLKEGEKYKDIQEISNYRRALFLANEHLNSFPIRLSFMRQLHEVLMSSVRGEDKSPGHFRTDQNWIGESGCLIEEATFVPPSPLQLNDYLLRWEAYLEFNDIDPLIQTSIVHAQFELIHPFKDGNGRIGRILIPLFLFQKDVLSQPMFYLSEYLENHREEYYRRLKLLSTDRDWNGWIEFFLRATIDQAEQNGQRVVDIKALYEEMKTEIQDITHSQYTVHILDAIFSKPIFATSDLAAKLAADFGVHEKTTSSLLKQLKDNQVLREIRAGKGRRPATLCFPRLINLAEGKIVI